MADSFIGEIQVFGFNYPPYGWALCEGQTMPIRSYTAVFALLSTYYGGDGRSTFCLPNLQSRVAIGQGQGPGLSDYYMGDTGGSESIALTIMEIPPHTHTLTGTNSTLNVSSQIGTQPGASSGTNTLAAFNDPNVAATNNAYNSQAPDITLNAGAPLSGTIGNMGNGMPFSLIQPTLGLNYSICLEGYFPPRS